MRSVVIVVAVAVVVLVASADCLLLQQSMLVLRVKPQGLRLALPLGYHLATPNVPQLSVSRQPQEATASPLAEPILVGPPPGLVASYETCRSKPTLRRSRAQ